jgi:hypothetical protein
MCYWCDSYAQRYTWRNKYYCSRECAEHAREGDIKCLEQIAFAKKQHHIIAKCELQQAKMETIKEFSNTDK